MDHRLLFLPIAYIATLLLFDKIFKYLSFGDKARWFFLHSLGNIMIVAECIPYICSFFADPIDSILNSPENHLSSIFIALIHIYHVVFFKLTKDDIFHHIAFVFVGEIVHLFLNIGDLTGIYHFFICGVPGAIDYFILGLYELDYLSKSFRLKVAAAINLWVRLPGITISFAYVLLTLCRKQENIYYLLIKVLVGYIISVYNASIYTDQVIRADVKYHMTQNQNKNESES